MKKKNQQWIGSRLIGIIAGLLLSIQTYASVVPSFVDTLSVTEDTQAVQDLAYSIFTTNVSDFSLGLLSQLFGSVGGLLQGTGSQLVGSVFAYFNIGVWVVVGLLIGYTTLMTTLRTSQQGTIMGEKMNIFALGRSLVGVGLVVPKYSGYSIIQALVLWTVIQGVNMANTMWGVVLTRAQSAEQVIATPQSGTVSEVKAVLDNTADLLRSQICMYSMADKNKKLKKKAKKALKKMKKKRLSPELQQLQTQAFSKDVMASTLLVPNYDTENHTVRFGGGIAKSALCGVYTWKLPKKLAYYQAYKRTAMQQMITALQPVAQSIVADADGMGTVISKVKTKNKKKRKKKKKRRLNAPLEPLPDCLLTPPNTLTTTNACSHSITLLTIAQTYLETMQPARDEQVKAEIGDSSRFYELARRQGWMLAGAHFYTLLQDKQRLILKNNQDYLFKPSDNSPPRAAKQFDRIKFVARGKVDKFFGEDKADLLYALRTVCEPDPDSAVSLCNNEQRIIDGNGYIQQAKILAGDGRIDWRKRSNKKQKKNSTVIGIDLGFSMPSFTKYNPYYLLTSDKSHRDAAYIRKFEGVAQRMGAIQSYAKEAVTPDLRYIKIFGIGKLMRRFVGDLWKSWTTLIGQNSTGEPLTDMREFGMNLISASARFMGNLTKQTSDVLLGTAAGYSAGLLVLAQGGAALTFIGKVFLKLGEAIPILMPIFRPLAQLFLALGAGIVTSMGWLTLAFSLTLAAIFYFLPLMLGIAVPAMIMGLLMAVYVPNLPFFMFTFAAIGWLIAVVEAVAASPLIALGVAHPERHDYLGNAEMAMMLLMSVLVRPALMIIGLVAAMIMSFAIVPFLHEGYLAILSEMVNYVVDSANAPTMVAASIGLILIYVMLMMAVTKMVYSLIYHLPDRVLRWIGGHPDESMTPHMLNQIMRQFQSATAQASEGGKGMVDSQRRTPVRPDPHILGLISAPLQKFMKK